MKRRVLSIFLVIAMLFNILPAPAIAVVSDFAGNTDAENRALLSQLSGLTGGDSEEAYNFLENFGLLDEEGNLNVSQTIRLDGSNMTLDEVITLLDDPGTDLSRIADVDGIPIALGDLKTMILIEQELTRIKETYFSGKTFSPEQLVLLQDLMNQIESEGISTAIMASQASDMAAQTMTAQTSGLLLKITPDSANPTSIVYGEGNKATLKYNLTLTGTMPESGVAGFSWKQVAGLMPDDYFQANLSLSIGDSSESWPEGQSFTFGPNHPNHNISDISQFSGTLTITVGSDTKTLEEMLGCNVTGSLWGFIEFYDATGITFSYENNESDLLAIPVKVSKPHAFESEATWLFSMEGVSDHDRNMTTDATGYDECKNPRWNLVDLNDDTMFANYDLLQKTAAEIFAGDDHYYKVDAYLMLTGTDMYGKDQYGYMRDVCPVGYDMQSPSQMLNPILYKWCISGELTQNPNEICEIDIYEDKLPVKGKPDWWWFYIHTHPETSLKECNYVSIVMASSDGKAPYTLNTVWPEGKDPIFTYNYPYNWDSGNFNFTDTGKQRTLSSSISLYDDKAPTLKTVEVPDGTYTTGQYVPILLTFSEPVDASQLSLTINGNDMMASELEMDSTGRKAVAMYWVKEADATSIYISSVDNLKDLSGNTNATENNSGSGWNFSSTVTLKSVLMKNAVTAVSVSPATIPLSDLAKGVTVTVSLNQAESYRTKYAAYHQIMKKAPFQIKLTNQGTGESRMVDTFLSDNLNSAEAVIKDLQADEGVGYTVEVIAYEDSTDVTGTLVQGKSASFTVGSIVYVDGVAMTYPADDREELSLGDTYRPKLGVVFKGNPTFKTGTWSSSDPSIATIEQYGQFVLTCTAVGKVSFTFTADNGGFEDPSSSPGINTATSKEYTVVAGEGASLVIPAEANRIIAKKGQDATVRWSGNAGLQSPEGAQFTVELFKGEHKESELDSQLVQHTVYAEKTANSVVIPGGELTELSIGGTPAYTVRISIPYPQVSGATLSAVGYIVVKAEPTAVHLQGPDSLYILDSQTAPIGWAVTNFEAGVTDGELLIERIYTEGDRDKKEEITKQSLPGGSGSYTLKPKTVSDLKDTYMVTLRARNSLDEVYSSDSFPLYVYNAGALKLEVNGQPVNSLNIDNEGKVSSGYLPEETDKILQLREWLALTEQIGINSKGYNWSQLKDGIKWATSDKDMVSINYRQGGLYEDISRFSMDTYLPETKMLLSSVKDGTATITATHANTGMSAAVNVNVKTLREKLYLFQLSPMQATEIHYTDGSGNQKMVCTNNEGVLALYEPDGIHSDVHLRSKGSDGSVWLGTIYQGTLYSGERDATRLQLYPLNTFKLRQAARAEIFLKKPDGSPYTGTLTLRGGVYKNGGYCQEARVLGNGDKVNLKDGKEPQYVSIGNDGKLTVYMDSTQFWSKEKGENSLSAQDLRPTDSFQYIFELTELAGYYPLLVYANGNLMLNDLMRSAESVISLESYTGAPQPFISNQTIDYGLSGGKLIDVRHSKGHIGPNEIYPEVKLLTNVLLWGQGTQNTYTLQLCDEYGYIPEAQMSQTVIYPFSSIPVMKNTLTMSTDTITDSGWVKPGKDMGLRVRLLREGTMLMELPISPRIVDFTRLPKLRDSANITGMMLELKGKSGVGPSASMSDGNKIIHGLMELLGKLNGPVDGSDFKMLITPSEDNMVFNAFIWAGYNSLGLDEVDYDQDGIAFDYKLADASLSTAPNLNDLTDMAKGSYDPDKTCQESMDNQAEGKGNHSVDFGGQLEGYFEAQIQYNFEHQKWEIYVLGGGFTAGFDISYTYTVNAQVGPVPVTASFIVGGGLQLDFKAALRYSEQSGLAWATWVTGNSVNDYLTTLRINAYVNAFGGLGFDYSVVALKIGLFGTVAFDNQNKFLSRTYLAEESKRQIRGQALQLSGEVGIKFVAQMLFISFEFVLGSGSLAYTHKFNQWEEIDNYWKNTGSGLKMSMLAQSPIGNSLVPISSTATLQSRDYLQQFARSWGSREKQFSLFGLDAENRLESLQSNAYPYSLPLVSADGLRLLYAFDNNSTDVGQTRIYATQRDNSDADFPQGSEIAAPPGFDGYGDSGLSMAGNQGFTVAAWVRQSTTLPKDAGQTLNRDEQALLMNATEIVAATAGNLGNWESKRLTNNASPDLAPVVAVSKGGDRAIVAWRSVYAADAADLLNFSQQDHILYSIYGDNTGWSEPQMLYNGTSGPVKGITAAMLSDGSAAIAYTLDTSRKGEPLDYEIGYTIVGIDNQPALSAIITQDQWLDENPQLVAVDFDSSSSVDERFVLGWHSVRGNVGDIRLAAFDNTGALSNRFIESIAQVGGNGVKSGKSFRFAKMHYWNDINNLSILWSESTVNDEGERDHGVLRAVKFIRDGSSIRISAAMDVAELPARTLTDHFDAFVTSDGKTVKAVLQGTEYKEIDPDAPNTYTEYDLGGGKNLKLPKEEVKLFTATETYTNKVRVDTVAVDYANLSLNALTPIQFTVFNAGMDLIDMVDVKAGDATKTFYFGQPIYPNESRTLTYWHNVGNTLENLDYELTAKFVYNFSRSEDTITGTVYLDYPDLGISRVKVVAEELGMRTLQLTLYNSSAATLAGGKNRSVRLGFYDDALFENIQEISCNTPAVIVNPDHTLTIRDEEHLKLIDEGAFTIELGFDIGTHMTDAAGHRQEIPDSGLRFYVNSWAEETSSATGQSRTALLPEYSRNNNSTSVLFESSLAREGVPVSISVGQGLSGDQTTATVRLHNNSLLNKTSGNLIVSLLDAGGNMLEQQQTYSANGSKGLIELEGEESQTFDFTFANSGNRVTATYGDVVIRSDNARLAALNFEGLQARLSDFMLEGGSYKFTAPDTALDSTLVNFVTEDPRATVAVNGQTASSGKRVALPAGPSRILLEVTAEDGQATESYLLSVNAAVVPADTYTLTITAGTGGSITVGSGGNYAAGTVIDITAIPASGYSFNKWTSTGGGTFANANNAGTTYTMPANPATITATFTYDSSSGGSSGGGGSSTTPSGIQVTPSGRTTSQNGVTLTFPAGAVENDIRVQVEEVSLTAGMTLPDNSQLLSCIMDIVKDKSGNFLKPVTITLSFDNSRLYQNEYDIAIYYYDEDTGKWIALDNIRLNLETGTISGDTTHFTKFAVIATPKVIKEEKPTKPATPIPSDVSGHWGKDSITKLINVEVISGYPDGTFQPNKAVTRAEFTVMLVKALKLEAKAWNPFADSSDHWAKDSIAIAAAHGIISGYDPNTFGPDDLITREQAAVIIARTAQLEAATGELGVTDSKAISPWAKPGVAAAFKGGFISGYPDGSFRPQGNTTRAEAAVIIGKLI